MNPIRCAYRDPSSFQSLASYNLGSVFILLNVLFSVFLNNPAQALYIVGAVMILLLLVGIRNAWDMVTFLAVERAHSENENKNVEVRDVGKTKRPKNKSSK